MISIGINLWAARSGGNTGPRASIAGLDAGIATVGQHGSITAAVSEGMIEARAWGTSSGGSQLGTGTSPTAFAANITLYLTLTVDGEDLASVSAPTRLAAPVAAGALADVTRIVGTTAAIATAADFTFAGTRAYSLTTAPAGATINSATGAIDISGVAVGAPTPVVVRCADDFDTTRFAQSGFDLDIDAATITASGGDAPSTAGITTIADGTTITAILAAMTDTGNPSTNGVGSVTTTRAVTVNGTAQTGSTEVSEDDMVRVIVTYSATGATDLVFTLGPITVSSGVSALWNTDNSTWGTDPTTWTVSSGVSAFWNTDNSTWGTDPATWGA